MGLSETTLNFILANPDSSPRPSTCRKLARFFGWDEDAILEIVGHRSPQTIREAPVPYTELLRRAEEEAPIPVPVPAQLHGGGGGVALEYTYLDPKIPHGLRLVGAYVRGDCMEPTIPDGSVVVVDLDASPHERQVVALTLNQDEPSIRRLLRRTDHSVILGCDNPAYPEVEEVEDVRVAGVVIAFNKRVE